MEKKKILISGATGNVGLDTLKGLKELKCQHDIIAGARNPEKAKALLKEFTGLSCQQFDFNDTGKFDAALQKTDIVFLLRPPQLADIPKYFIPFFDAMKKNGVNKIVFLSVQGVESQKKIPHHKMEKAILEYGFEYVFLRPAYFMQNLTTTLLHEIKNDNKIFIPCGKLKMNWVNVADIGLVGAHVLNDFEKYKNRSFEITGSEFEGFEKVAKLLSKELGREIKYESPNLMKFFRAKRKLGIAKPMIWVMIMLHYLPRLGKNEKRLTNVVKEITGKEPGTLTEFIKRERNNFK